MAVRSTKGLMHEPFAQGEKPRRLKFLLELFFIGPLFKMIH